MGKLKGAQEYMGYGELTQISTWRAVAAEFVGTMMLTLIVCWSCLSLDPAKPSTVVQIAFAVGIIVFCMVQALCHVSGGHINPAVTCAMLVARYVSVVRALLYIFAQCLGAIVAAGILKGLTPAEQQGTLGMTAVHPSLNSGQAFGVEVVITFILLLTVFGVCDERRGDVKGSGPLAIGLSITACHLGAIPFTGAAMNPARSFGPAVVMGLWENHWVYWAGPIAGGIVASLLYTFVFRAPKDASYDVELDTYGKRSTNP